jgi:hypothetical protein
MPRVKLRRDDSYQWARFNPVLYEGEPGYERDTKRLKIGDGITPWNDLPYFVPRSGEEAPVDLSEHIADPEPHPVYDDGPSLLLLYENAKV